MDIFTQLESHARIYLDQLEAKPTDAARTLAIIQRVLAAPGVYLFAELLRHPTVQLLADDPETQAYHRLLTTFAFGTWREWKAESDLKITLSPQQEAKLKQLSILSIAEGQQTLLFTDLMGPLDIEDSDHLENLLTDLIYQGIIKGKLSQSQRTLYIDFAVSREVVIDRDLTGISQAIEEWSSTTKNLVNELERSIVDLDAWRTHNQPKKPANDPADVLALDTVDEGYKLPQDLQGVQDEEHASLQILHRLVALATP
ncbi:hypothetical protein BJ085DRAFT_39777 [Dimargaris cristalligena]|uniref:PCI domain-containing protein n=1 Tax=Dimargaris cristalligena TaxID=215637 RepID=A0A4P9ZV99_9FUNG|nr:hypothetical protein BJ085DRAFT_39777 [Dimargaris cristalligena]|eukprot:RKP36851.1 hypothetical protein BJ085DRAFT_39777 [Dimargaris cristalligena]